MKPIFYIIISIIVFVIITVYLFGFKNNRENFSATTYISENEINTELSTVRNLIDKYNNLDIPITISNDGNFCNIWGNYNNGTYTKYGNKCELISGSPIRQCRSNTGLASCSNFYDGGQLDTYNSININDIMQLFKNNIKKNVDDISNFIEVKARDLDANVTNANSYQLTLAAQRDLISKNTISLDDKKKFREEKHSKFEKEQDDVEIDQVNFKIYLENKKIGEDKLSLYRKIIYVLIITIFIVLIINYLLTETL